MDITKKHVFAAAAALGLVLLVNHASDVSKTINGLQFGFAPAGLPSFQGTSLVWPVKVTVTNAGTVSLPLQGVAMTLDHLAANGTATQIAATDPAGVPATAIQARSVTTLTVPIKTSLLGLATELASIIQARGLGRYRLNPSIYEQGVKIDLKSILLTY